MRTHPLLVTESENIKVAFPVLGTILAIGSILGLLGGGAFAYNQLRRAWRGPEYDQYINVFPAFGSAMPRMPMGGQPAGNWNFGYAIPGALAGAALGGLLGKSWSGAALGGLAGAGLGYMLGRSRMGQA